MQKQKAMWKVYAELSPVNTDCRTVIAKDII